MDGVIRETLADLQRRPHTSLSLHGVPLKRRHYQEQARFPQLRAAPADGPRCELMATNICGSGGEVIWEDLGSPVVSATCPQHSI